MLRFLALTALLCALFSSGCSYFRLPVLQGNIVDYEKAEKLQLGMTPAQVEFLLGTPLVRDSFGTPRWDYVVYYRSPDADVLQRNLSVYFEDDRVSRIEGRDEMLAAWRKQKAIIEKAKKEKKLLETPHPGQLPADAGAPVDAAGNEDEHGVLPPRDPKAREEILEEESEPEINNSEDDGDSVPEPPEPTQSNEPIEPAGDESDGDESSDQAASESEAESDTQATASSENSENDYPPDMSTIYQQR
ncbi:MAG: outer membrane protein assembly factor BamE [Salinisphaeraceae bacterium]|nr:outer membrane protein assembly factor BamE [Salinisphaeraceae bacterium]